MNQMLILFLLFRFLVSAACQSQTNRNIIYIQPFYVGILCLVFRSESGKRLELSSAMLSGENSRSVLHALLTCLDDLSSWTYQRMTQTLSAPSAYGTSIILHCIRLHYISMYYITFYDITIIYYIALYLYCTSLYCRFIGPCNHNIHAYKLKSVVIYS